MKHCSNGIRRTAAGPIATLTGLLNGRERSFPLSCVPPERFVDLCAASELMARHGGMQATPVDVTTSLVQIAFRGVDDSERASCQARGFAAHLLEIGLGATSQSLPVGCMPALKVRAFGADGVLVSLYVERAGGFGIIEPAARAIVPELARLIGARAAPTFALGVAEHRRVRVQASLPISALYHDVHAPEQRRSGGLLFKGALDQVLARYVDAGHAPELAFEQNARVLSAIAAGSEMFGAASDVVQAEGRAHAARWGSCERLVQWEQVEDQLTVELEVPVALQRVRGVLNSAAIETACSIAEIDCLRTLEFACASIGLIASVSGLYADRRREAGARPRIALRRDPLAARPERCAAVRPARAGLHETGALLH